MMELASGEQSLGVHYLLSIFECKSNVLDDLHKVSSILVEATSRAHASMTGMITRKFDPLVPGTPAGVSVVIGIEESHVSIHTWPENSKASADVYTCGDDMEPEIAVKYIVRRFGSRRTEVTVFDRNANRVISTYTIPKLRRKTA